MIIEGPVRLAARVITSPEIVGTDRLADLASMEEPPPVIFAPTHHSHLDTGLMIRAVPSAWRHKLVVAAAADYFFDKKWKAALSALSLNAIPIDRELTGRKSSDLIKGLIDDGYSLVIYPEGGRSPDGWGQEFKGGAAYLSARTGAPVVPVFIDGTGRDLRQGHEATQAGPHQDRVRRTDATATRTSRPGASTPGSRPRSRCSATRRSPTSGPPGSALPPGPTRRSPARSTPDGDATGHSPNGDGSAPPGSGAVSNAAGPTSADTQPTRSSPRR